MRSIVAIALALVTACTALTGTAFACGEQASAQAPCCCCERSSEAAPHPEHRLERACPCTIDSAPARVPPPYRGEVTTEPSTRVTPVSATACITLELSRPDEHELPIAAARLRALPVPSRSLVAQKIALLI